MEAIIVMVRKGYSTQSHSLRKTDPHCLRLFNISLEEAKRLVTDANRSLAAGFNFVVEDLTSKNRRATEDISSLYLARYEFGDGLISTFSSHSNGNFFIPPCIQTGRPCRICRALSAESGHDWPLFIILNKTRQF
jgi:hypothetical protein